MMIFKNRADAANQLVELLQEYKDKDDVVIITIPRGGLELGSVLAEKLHAPLDIVLVKKIGAPWNSEMAIGAVSMHEMILNPNFDNPEIHDYIKLEVKKLQDLLNVRYQKYMGDSQPIPLKGKRVILVDDGVATGKTILMALKVLHHQKPKEIIVALPVVPESVLPRLQNNADKVISLQTPTLFQAVGAFYKNFKQVSDDEAIALLTQAKR